MNEKVESGLDAVAWAVAVEGYQTLLIDNYGRALAEQEHFQGRGRTANVSPLVRQSDAERALQQQHEAHRKTWTQLEQLARLLRDVECRGSMTGWEPGLIDQITAALSKQAEPVEPAPAQGERDSLAERMRAAGMLTIDEMLSGAPLDRFIRHAGVNDLDTYGQWLEMKCREFLSMQASRELEKREDDDLYEWVLAHAAAFQEARINFNAARPAQTEQQPFGWFTDDHLTDKSATTYDRNVAARWREKGWAVHELYAAPIAQTTPQPEQINIDPLLNAGATLSNIAFNLAQRPGVTLDQHVCDTLSSARKHWDEARAALPAPPSPAMDAKEE